MSSMVAALQNVASRQPEQSALVGEMYSLTFRQLMSEVRIMAAHLKAYRGQVVALLADNCPEWLVIDLAAQQAGVVLLPLPVYFTTQQIHHALNAAGAQGLIYQPDFLPDDFKNQHDGKLPPFSYVSLQLLDGPFGDAVSLPAGTAKITFTSGSTGTPKGVCLSNQQQCNVVHSILSVTGLSAPRHLAVLPLSTLLENVAGVYAPLMAGGEVTLLPIMKSGYTAGHRQFLQTISASRPETLILVPELLAVLVNAVDEGWQPPDSLKFIAVGGSRVAADLILKARRAGLPVYEGYGLSEAGSVVCLNSIHADQPGTAGKPLPHLSVGIESGEIVIYGSQFLGYIGDDNTPSEKLHTGDLGRLDDAGFLQVIGRKKQLIISSYGRNINPEWVESEVLSDPAIQQCVVFGDARPYCTALIYSTLADAELQQHINRVNHDLPDYARIYRWYRLPEPLHTAHGLLTANGRPKRQAIFAHYQHIINTLYQEENHGILYHTAG